MNDPDYFAMLRKEEAVREAIEEMVGDPRLPRLHEYRMSDAGWEIFEDWLVENKPDLIGDRPVRSLVRWGPDPITWLNPGCFPDLYRVGEWTIAWSQPLLFGVRLLVGPIADASSFIGCKEGGADVQISDSRAFNVGSDAWADYRTREDMLAARTKWRGVGPPPSKGLVRFQTREMASTEYAEPAEG